MANRTDAAGTERFSAVVGQMSLLAGFMFCDGREAFETLSAGTGAEMQMLFNALNGELQELFAGVRHA